MHLCSLAALRARQSIFSGHDPYDIKGYQCHTTTSIGGFGKLCHVGNRSAFAPLGWPGSGRRTSANGGPAVGATGATATAAAATAAQRADGSAAAYIGADQAAATAGA